jgi:hypothetical protein
MSARFYGKAETAATEILNAFRNPQGLPSALAPIFIRRKDNIPCRQWSWSNQLLVAIRGYSDARGFRQWNEIGRFVRKGEHGFPILVPLTKRVEQADKESGEKSDRFMVYGFKHAIVFGASQTDGEPLPPPDADVAEWIGRLPLLDVARDWGLSVEAYSGRYGQALGKYVHGQAIALGVQNLATWSHEMIHAADDRLGKLTERGQHWRSETVAELGGAVLLTCLGLEHDADVGGCWEYVSAYARDAGLEPLVACQRALKRTCDAVALILDTAETLQAAESLASA